MMFARKEKGFKGMREGGREIKPNLGSSNSDSGGMGSISTVLDSERNVPLLPVFCLERLNGYSWPVLNHCLINNITHHLYTHKFVSE